MRRTTRFRLLLPHLLFASLLAGSVPSLCGLCHGAETGLRTVEELPVDRFDEYPAGTIPPQPWFPLTPETEGVSLSLKAEDESGFVGNTATGKGLVIDDQSATSGRGAGLACSFLAPPEGKVYLGVDFKFAETEDRQGYDPVCRLDDGDGTGMQLHLGLGGNLSLLAPDGTLKPLAPLTPGMWYHLSVTVSGNNLTLQLLDRDNAKPDQYSVKVKDETKVIRAEAEFAAPSRYTRLSFFNNGSDTATGSWTVDNICMAGHVDAPRERWFPFDPAPIAELRASPKKSYAYYYIYTSGYSNDDPGLSWYTRTVLNPALTKETRRKAGSEMMMRPLPRVPMDAPELDKRGQIERAMEEEVRLAIMEGLDGFFADFHSHPKAEGGVAHFTENSFSLMDAAQAVDKEFKILPAVYSSSGISGVKGEADAGCDPLDYANSPILKRIAEHPATLRLPDGRFILSMWLTERHSAEWWKQVLAQLEQNGTPAALVGQFNSWGALGSFKGLCLGMAQWGPRSPLDYDWVEKARPLTEKVVFPICNQDVRTRACMLWEAEGSGLLRNLWGQAIEDGADWAFLNTWSDFTETPMTPSTFIGFVPYDLNAYYSQWFKTGRQPAIVRDRLYYFYRRNHSQTVPQQGTVWRFQNGGAKDEIELLAFLTEPGELSITVAGETCRMDAPAGITSFKVPMPENLRFTPEFGLTRNGNVIASRKGRYAVLDVVEYQHMAYSSGVIPTNAELEP